MLLYLELWQHEVCLVRVGVVGGLVIKAVVPVPTPAANPIPNITARVRDTGSLLILFGPES